MKTKQVISLAVYLVAWLIALSVTFEDARFIDGPLSVGFPLPFYAGGGYCGMPCGPYLLFGNLVIDIVVFLVPIVVGVWYFRRRGEK